MIWILTISSVLLYVTPVFSTDGPCKKDIDCVNLHEQCNIYTNKCVCTTGYTADNKGVCNSNSLPVLTMVLLGTLVPGSLILLIGFILVCIRRREYLQAISGGNPALMN
ncbi:Uncharacterised protein g9347 [Pycnogonum litorale]